MDVMGEGEEWQGVRSYLSQSERSRRRVEIHTAGTKGVARNHFPEPVKEGPVRDPDTIIDKLSINWGPRGQRQGVSNPIAALISEWQS